MTISSTALAGYALMAIAAGGACAAPAPAAGVADLARSVAPLPLGHPGLPQSVRSKRLAPGVTHIKVRRGTVDSSDAWYLLGDVVRNDDALAKLEACFAKLGLVSRSTEFHIPGASESTYRIVSGGKFSTRAKALESAQPVAGDCPLYPRHSSADSSNQTGPWSIDIVAIVPQKSQGRWTVAMKASGDGLRERTSHLSRSHQALLGINGGFFVERAADGVPGQAAGVSILSGRVNGSPIANRPAVVVSEAPHRAIGIARDFSWQTFLAWSDGSRTVIDGINRKPGIVRNCGRTQADQAIHDYTCEYQDDLVYYPPGTAAAGVLRQNVQFAIDESGTVRPLATGAAFSPSDGLLAGTPGSDRLAHIERQAARQLKASFQLESSLLSNFGNSISVVNAGPTLLMRGEYVRQDAREGWAIDATDQPQHALLMHDWINRRNPRSAIGIRKDGTILIVVTDGHRHKSAVGATVEELRKVMGALGAADAVNLDGGGSSTLVLRNHVVNDPSDLEGERKIGDAILFTEDKNIRRQGK